MATTQSIFDAVEAKGPDTKEGSVTKTLVCSLQTSQNKNKHINECVNRWQEIADFMSNVMVSHNSHQWRGQISTNDYVIHRKFPDNNGLKLSTARTAANKVASSYSSWDSNGRPTDETPKGDFGDGSYARMAKSDITVDENDKGYGVKLSMIPYDPIWFHINGGSYHYEILNAIVNKDSVSHGSGEIHLYDNDNPVLHLTYTIDVDIYKKPELDRWIGVDLGEAKMWVCSPVGPDGPLGASLFAQHSNEFRENRERLKREGDRLRRNGDLNAQKARQQRRDYTDTMTHTASYDIVDFAVEHKPCGIALEDLTNYRKTAENPIHDWPYTQLQEKIIYKANERGIPIRKVDAYGTSAECWKCGTDEYAERVDRDTLICSECGDERHADVNAAINIGKRAI